MENFLRLQNINRTYLINLFSYKLNVFLYSMHRKNLLNVNFFRYCDGRKHGIYINILLILLNLRILESFFINKTNLITHRVSAHDNSLLL